MVKLGQVDYSKKLAKPELSLCRPSKEIIDFMNTAYEISFDEALGALNSLEFKLPFFIDKNHQIVRNNTVDIIRGRYTVYLELGNHKEYFIINSLENNGSGRNEYMRVKCLSLGYELNDTPIRGFEVESKNASEILNELLKNTIWKKGYVDSEFDLMYRKLEISSANVFEGISEISKTFNALVRYDSINRTVSLIRPELSGINKGLNVSYEKYLESINQEDNSEEVISRLEMYGNENVSIQEINPSGQPYIEDFSYYMYPYEEKFSKTEDIVSGLDMLSLWSKIGFSSNFTNESNGVRIQSIGSVSNKIISSNTYGNVELNFNVKNVSNNNDARYGIIVGYMDNSNYYYITHDKKTTSPRVSIYKVSNGMTTLVFKDEEKISSWSSNMVYNLKVEVLNGIIFVKIDNVTVASFKDSVNIVGKIGFLTQNNDAIFYNLKITNIYLEIVNRSEFLSDELCYYMKRYEELLKSSEGEFSNLIGYRDAYNNQLTVLGNEFSTLELERKKLLDERDILNTKIARNVDLINKEDNVENSTDFLENTNSSLVEQRDAKLAEIKAKEQQIKLKNDEIASVTVLHDGIEHKILLYRVKISLESNFPEPYLTERKQHTISKVWQDNNIIEPEALLKEGKKVFDEYRKQKITVTVDIVDFRQMITEQKNWDKLILGDDFEIEHSRMNLTYEAKITGINHDFENKKVKIIISNVKDLLSNKNKFLDALNKTNSISSSITMKEWEWDLSLENKGSINEIINGIWDANRQAIIGAKDQVVEISDRGLIIRDENNPDVYLVGINGMIAITNDGGDTFKHAITSEGIVGERVYGKIIMGVNLAIEDESGILFVQGSRIKIYNRDKELRMQLGLVEENGVCGEAFGLISMNDITQVKITDCEGFVINRRNYDTAQYPTGWEKVFWTNVDGTIFAHDLIVSNIKVVQNKEWDKYIMDAELGFFDLGFFSKIVKDGKLTTDEKLQLITEMIKIGSSYMTVKKQAQKYMYVDRDDNIDFNQGFNTSTDDFPRQESSQAKIDLQPLKNAYLELINFMSSYIKITSLNPHEPLQIKIEDEMTETTSDLGTNRQKLVLLFKNYYDEYDKISDNIEDVIVYQGISMGKNYNNVFVGEHGLVVVRNDGMYRAYLNATNGLALEKWENGTWVKKLFATLGDPMWEDGTLYAEGLVTKNLRIVDAHMNEKIIFDWYDGITIFGDSATIFLNANDGIKIEDLSGDKKFWVGIDGDLYAKDITTHNLKIVDGNLGEKIIFDHNDGITINGNNGEQIRLNANEGIAIDVNGENRFWIGTNGFLYARKLFILNGDLDEDILNQIDDDGSFISDLTVTRLRTLDMNDLDNYILIKQKFMKFMTGDMAKYEMYFEGSGVSAYPVAIWGTGSGNNINNNKAKQYKTPEGFYTEYVDEAGEKHVISLNTDVNKSIELLSPKTIHFKGGKGEVTMNNSKLELKFGNNIFLMTDAGIKINGTRIDLN